MGWKPAQEAAGHDWFYPFLVYGMSDPYAAVRFVSWKSLQTLPLRRFSVYLYSGRADAKPEYCNCVPKMVARSAKAWVCI
jgi:hypothetical protein